MRVNSLSMDFNPNLLLVTLCCRNRSNRKAYRQIVQSFGLNPRHEFYLDLTFLLSPARVTLNIERKIQHQFCKVSACFTACLPQHVCMKPNRPSFIKGPRSKIRRVSELISKQSQSYQAKVYMNFNIVISKHLLFNTYLQQFVHQCQKPGHQ